MEKKKIQKTQRGRKGHKKAKKTQNTQTCNATPQKDAKHANIKSDPQKDTLDKKDTGLYPIFVSNSVSTKKTHRPLDFIGNVPDTKVCRILHEDSYIGTLSTILD